jgi:hypothetical protein
MSNANEPAFPQVTTTPAYTSDRELYADTSSTGGLTKREYFAGLAMQGLLADSTCDLESAEAFARMSVAMAGALLAELERTA